VDAIKSYNNAIKVCGDAKDFATRELLENILKDEDAHIDASRKSRTRLNRWGWEFSCPFRSLVRI